MIQLVRRMLPISPSSTISFSFWYSGLLRWLNMMAKDSSGLLAANSLSSLTCLVYTPAGFSTRAWMLRLRVSMPISGCRKCGTQVTTASTSPLSSMAM